MLGVRFSVRSVAVCAARAEKQLEYHGGKAHDGQDSTENQYEKASYQSVHCLLVLCCGLCRGTQPSVPNGTCQARFLPFYSASSTIFVPIRLFMTDMNT